MPKSGDSAPIARGTRLIHIRLNAETHRRLRVATAEEDVTIQEWVAALVERELDRRHGPKDRKGRL